jgi:hypothetical protein
MQTAAPLFYVANLSGDANIHLSRIHPAKLNQQQI